MTQAIDWPGLGDDELLIAVANTAHGESDELADAGSVRAWWRSVGAPVPTRRGQSESTETVATLRGLRGVIRALALRNNGIEAGVSDVDLVLRLDLRGNPRLRA